MGANNNQSQEHETAANKSCHCLPKQVDSRASSSESLQGASMQKEAGASSNRFLYNVWHKIRSGGHSSEGLGTYSGVLIPTCENMWGVLIFLRFFYIVGSAGVWQTFLIVFISFLCAMLTTMSLSAIATNGPIEQGGTYYLISRALGPKLGGAVGLLYYLGVVLLSVLEALGSVEMIVFTFPALDFTSSNRIIAAIILIFLGLLVFVGIKLVAKLGLAFFAIVLYTMLSFYLGLGLAPRGSSPPSLTGLSWTTFKSNWSPGYPHGKSFSTAVSLFFPCFTGILSGADRATALRRPEKSIPQGTLGAIIISFIMYMSYMGLWAAVAQRDYLLGNIGGAHAMLMVVREVAYPLAILTELGIIIASISQAMQCLIVSPRLLQAIAADGVVPFLGPLAKMSNNGEPRRALMVTTVLCFAFSMMGSLDIVAPLVSICFLTCYSALNLSCLVLSAVNAPSWRPKWKYYHWSAALVGFLACVAMNFVIVWYWAVVAIVLLIGIYVYIDFRQVEVNWGTGLGGLCLQIAVRGILSVGDEARYTVNWRPQLLCLSKPRSAWTDNEHAGHQFLFFASQLKKGQGLYVVTAILEGKLGENTAQATAEKVELDNRMNESKVTGFGRVLIAPTYREGKTYAIQSSGLGSLEPNTLVQGWPTKWREPGHEDSAEILLETLTECRAVDKAVLLCVNLDRFPAIDEFQEGTIDVWWIVHDGGLLLLLAHLLQQHKIWRKCKLRVHTVAEKLDNSEVVKKNLEKLLELVRIKAEVQVLEMDESELAPYTFDYTLRAEEARDYAEKVAMYCKIIEQRRAADKADRRLSFEMPRANDQKAKDGLPKFQVRDLNKTRRKKEGGVRRDWGSPSRGPTESPKHGKDAYPVILSSTNKQSSSSVVPSLLPLSPYRGSSTTTSSPSRSPGNSPMASPIHNIPRKKSHSLDLERGSSFLPGEEAAPQTQPRRLVSNLAVNTTRDGTTAKPKKEAHWADRDASSDDAKSCNNNNINKEIVVDVHDRCNSDNETGDDSGSGDNDDDDDGASSRRSTSHVYPGSPGGYGGGTLEDVPEPMRRTWSSFSQNFSPRTLNDIIVEQSRGAQLILINLPDHYEGMQPSRYMEYCEDLCKGLQRVLLVHGTGKELWGGQAHLGL